MATELPHIPLVKLSLSHHIPLLVAIGAGVRVGIEEFESTKHCCVGLEDMVECRVEAHTLTTRSSDSEPFALLSAGFRAVSSCLTHYG
jgi:hypothetical protein